jgi:phosphatidylserine decarboxylase
MTLRIHREGRKIILSALLLLSALIALTIYLTEPAGILSMIVYIASAALLAFVLRFFRKPHRLPAYEPGKVYSPADGHIVAIEETPEDEVCKDKRLLISVFMSVWNVHINWYPVDGTVSYVKYHPGKYLLARHPKSSVLNERTTVAIKTPSGTEIVLRQIAGAVARRIVCYAKKDLPTNGPTEMGFIKFGSRVDVYLPIGSTPTVALGDKVKGTLTPLALLKNP